MDKATSVQLDNLSQPPFNTTLMGVLKGAMNYYGIERTAPFVYGASGHAFLINIHKEICPSGPYCWNPAEFFRLARNLGIQFADLGFFHAQSALEERAAVEAKVRQALDKAIVCSLVNMEHQLITGYDEEGFFTARPWQCTNDFPPARLTFGAWNELGQQIHITFFILEKCEPAAARKAILDSLDNAVDLFTNPTKYADKDYGAGPNAYANWIAAVETHGSSHGQWWNATVWSECRQMAAQYFAEIAAAEPQLAPQATGLSADYSAIADLLSQVANKELDNGKKKELLIAASEREAQAIRTIEAFADLLKRS